MTSTDDKRSKGYRRQRFEARKVRRLIRHIDPWSILKLSTLLALCMWSVIMIAAAIMWVVVTNAGTIESLENFVNSSLSLRDWSIDGGFLFRQLGLISFIGCIGFVLATVTATFIFNLASDIMGGIWISVVEEETARPVRERARPPVSVDGADDASRLEKVTSGNVTDRRGISGSDSGAIAQ